MNISFGTSRRIAGPVRDTSFRLVASPRQVLVSAGSASAATLGHAQFDTETESTIDTVSDVRFDYGLGISRRNGTLENLTPSIATITDQGVMTRVADGIAKIRGTVPGVLGAVEASIAVARTGGSTAYAFTSFTSDSLEKAMNDAVTAAIAAGGGAGCDVRLWSTAGTASTPFVRNPNRWFPSLDLTCVSAYSTWFAGWKPYVFPVTLVSSRHFISAWHIGNLSQDGPSGNQPIGHAFYFVKADGTRVGPYTCIAQTKILDTNGDATDIRVCQLDQDVAAGISFAKVLPANFATKLPSFAAQLAVGLTPRGPLVVSVGQENDLRPAEVYDIGTWVKGISTHPGTGDAASLYRTIYSGDSGSGTFAVIGGEPVLIKAHTTGYGGQSIADFITQINAWMTANGGKVLTEVDISSFT